MLYVDTRWLAYLTRLALFAPVHPAFTHEDAGVVCATERIKVALSLEVGFFGNAIFGAATMRALFLIVLRAAGSTKELEREREGP